MADKVEFVLDAKDEGAVAAWQAVARGVVDYERELAKIDSIESKNQKASEAHGKTAKKVIEGLMTDQQRLNARLEQLDLLRKKNKLSEEQYAAAVRQTKAEFHAATETNRLNALTTRVLGLVGGFTAVTSAVRTFIDANSELERKAEEIADKYDVMFRRFQAMSGFNTLQTEEAKGRIKEIALARKLETLDPAEAGASALTSSGFSGAEASGGSLDALLRILSAQQMVGKNVDVAGIAGTSAQYLESQGLEKTKGNLLGLGVAIQSLKETKLTFNDMQYLAKEGAALKQAGVTKDEQIATYGTLRDTLDASSGASTFRNVALHMATAGGAKDKTAALKELGLKPADVDMVGESFLDAIGKVDEKLKQAAPEKRNRLLKTLFESENIATFGLIAGSREKIAERAGRLTDAATFNQDVATAESGRAAGGRQQRLALELETEKRNRDAGKLFNEIELMNLEQGGSAFANKSFRTAAEMYQGLGYEPAQAATAALTGFRNAPFARMTGFTGEESSLSIVDQAQNRLESRMAASLDRNTAVVERNNQLIEEQNQSRPLGNTAPAQPVASKGREGGR